MFLRFAMCQAHLSTCFFFFYYLAFIVSLVVPSNPRAICHYLIMLLGWNYLTFFFRVLLASPCTLIKPIVPQLIAG